MALRSVPPQGHFVFQYGMLSLVASPIAAGLTSFSPRREGFAAGVGWAGGLACRPRRAGLLRRLGLVVVSCDLRGYTAFTETAEPEEVLDFLRDYHGTLGPLVAQFEGTLDQFSGDGIMVFFNDPVPIPEPAQRAVRMAIARREAAGTLIAHWRERGRDLGLVDGIAQGYATLGRIGFSERSGYTAIGTVCNVAARLCAEAKDGQILLSQRVNAALRGSVVTEQVGALPLKGLAQPVMANNVSPVGSQTTFHVIEGGAPSASRAGSDSMTPLGQKRRFDDLARNAEAEPKRARGAGPRPPIRRSRPF
jgi:class 3 adenylate cyclase